MLRAHPTLALDLEEHSFSVEDCGDYPTERKIGEGVKE